MRAFPIDSDRVEMIATGRVAPMPAWVELADGSRRPDPNGRQEIDQATGQPMWAVEVVLPFDEDDDRDKSEAVQIPVPAQDAPQVTAWRPVRFLGLTMSPGYLSRKTGQVTPVRWAAMGIADAKSGNGHRAATPAPAAS